MSVISSQFVLFVLIGILIFNASDSKHWKTSVFAALNIIFIATYVHKWYEIMPLILFVLFGYFVIKLSYGLKTKFLTVFLSIMTILAFIYLKQYPIAHLLPSLPFPYVVAGISYIMFRMLHLSMDISSGELEDRVTFVDYFNYVFSFLTFVSGPIQRYEDFEAQFRDNRYKNNPTTNVFPIIERVAAGFFKTVVFSGIFFALHQATFAKIADGTGVSVVKHVFFFSISASLYTLFLYYNFSGCMDVVIGLGRFFGFVLPENFTAPFGARNFIDFWSRWHISLSEWFKFYMFNPMMKFLIKWKPSQGLLPFYGVLTYFVTFAVLGAWHGTVYVGLCFGLGVSVNKLYEIILTKKIGRDNYTKMTGSKILNLINRGLVFGYVSLSLVYLWNSPEDVHAAARHVGTSGAIIFLCAMSAMASAFFLFADFIQKICSSSCSKYLSFSRSIVFRQLWLSIKILIIAHCLLTHLTFIPEVAYKAF